MNIIKKFSMKMGKNTKTASLTLFFVFVLSGPAYAKSVAWPELVLFMHYLENAWLLGVVFLVGWPTMKLVTNLSWSKSIVPSILRSLFLIVAGAALLPAGGFFVLAFLGIVYEAFDLHTYLIDQGHFLLYQILGYATSLIFNTTTVVVLEVLFLKFLFRKKVNFASFKEVTFLASKKNVAILVGAFFLSIGVAIVHMKYTGPSDFWSL